MKKKHRFKLVHGQFNPDDARSVLFALINSKISFHSIESFGISIRTNGETSYHQKRIKELREANADIKEILMYAEENNLTLNIDGDIEINLVDDSTGK